MTGALHLAAKLLIWGGGLVALALVAFELWRHRAAIRAALFPGERIEFTAADRWRRVHIDADRRRPFEDARGRRGPFGPGPR